MVLSSNRVEKIAGYFRSLVTKLLNLHDAPHSLAGGVAIGIFMGFTPLFGLKTLLCVGVSYLFRCNPIAAVIAVSLHDVVAPFWPVLLELEYAIGSRIVGFFDGVAHPASVTDFHVHDLMKWTTFFTIGLPMLVGSVFLSAPAAALSYAVMLPVFKSRARRRQSSQVGEGI
jgi:uncharacterized protein (DUF2062 family)